MGPMYQNGHWQSLMALFAKMAAGGFHRSSRGVLLFIDEAWKVLHFSKIKTHRYP